MHAYITCMVHGVHDEFLLTILGALVKIAGVSIDCVSIGVGRSTACSKSLVLNVDDICIPPLSCNNRILAALLTILVLAYKEDGELCK